MARKSCFVCVSTDATMLSRCPQLVSAGWMTRYFYDDEERLPHAAVGSYECRDPED